MHKNKRKYATICCSLHKKAAEKLKDLAEKRCKTESEILRQIIDAYFKKMENNKMWYKHFKRISPVGLEHLSRTITKEQDKRLRLLASKTGKSISEMMREAFEESVEEFSLDFYN